MKDQLKKEDVSLSDRNKRLAEIQKAEAAVNERAKCHENQAKGGQEIQGSGGREKESA